MGVIIFPPIRPRLDICREIWYTNDRGGDHVKYYGLSIPKLVVYSILWPLCPFSLMLGFTFIICMSGDASQWQYFIGEILFVALLMGGYIYYFH